MLSLCTRSVYAMSESAASCMHTPMWLTRSHQCSYMDKQCVAVWRLQVPTQCHPYISPTLFVTTGCPALIHNQIVHHRNKVQLRLSARTLVWWRSAPIIPVMHLQLFHIHMMCVGRAAICLFCRPLLFRSAVIISWGWVNVGSCVWVVPGNYCDLITLFVLSTLRVITWIHTLQYKPYERVVDLTMWLLALMAQSSTYQFKCGWFYKVNYYNIYKCSC